MSDLESASQPLLTGLAEGESVELAADDQRSIAKWLTKTGLMMDFATHAPKIPSENYHSLFETGDPNDFTAVLHSSFPMGAAGPDLACMRQGDSMTPKWWSHSRGDYLGSPARFYLQTLKLGLFVGQVFWTDDVDLADYFVKDARSAGHIRAWPKPSKQRWPTTEIISFDAFRIFGRRLAGVSLG